MRQGIIGVFFTAALVFGVVAVALAAEIIIPGDMISVTVAGEPEFSRTVVVDSAGSVNLEKAGPVELAGMSIAEAASKVAAALSEYVKAARVTISIVSPAPRTAVVSGQVVKPGAYAIASETTLADLIEMAGGPTEGADLTRVVVTRGYAKDKLIAANLEAFRQGTDPAGSPFIYPGDSVLVPVKPVEGGSVYAVGEVVLKGPVPYREGITAREALAAAGGPTGLADLNNVTIKRKGQPDKVVDYAKVLAGDPGANVVLQRGDSVFLPTLELKGGYTVKGAVNSPGEYLLRGFTRLTDALAQAGGLKEKAAPTRIKIVRKAEGKKKTLNYNLEDISIGRATDPVIQSGDILTVQKKRSSVSPGKLAGALVGLYLLIAK